MRNLINIKFKKHKLLCICILFQLIFSCRINDNKVRGSIGGLPSTEVAPPIDPPTDSIIDTITTKIGNLIFQDIRFYKKSSGQNLSNPGVSPDGTLVFQVSSNFENNYFELLVMNVDGSNLRKVPLPFSWTSSESASQIIITPDNQKIIFRNRDVSINSYNLYSVYLDGSNLVKLNGTLQPGASVIAFKLAANNKIVYQADEDILGRSEIYSINLDGTNKVKLNQALSPTGIVNNWKLSNSGNKILMLSNPTAAAGLNLYSSNIDGTNLSQINPALVTGGTVFAYFNFSPDESEAVFTGDVLTDNLTETFIANIDGTNFRKISPLLIPAGDVANGDPIFSSDGSRVLLRADAEVDNKIELYSCLPDGSGCVKLNPVLPIDRDVGNFYLTPNGLKAIFYVNLTSLSRLDLFSVNLDGSNLIPLDGNTTSTALGIFSTFSQILSDSSSIIYFADHDSNSKMELYKVNLDGTGQTLLSSGLNPLDTVVQFWKNEVLNILYYTVTLNGENNQIRTVYKTDLSGTSPIAINDFCSVYAQIAQFIPFLSGNRVVLSLNTNSTSTPGNTTISTDQDGLNQFEIPAINNPSFSLNSIQLLTNNQSIVFTKEGSTLGSNDLFKSNIDGSGVVKLNSSSNNRTNKFWVSTDNENIFSFTSPFSNPSNSDLYRTSISGTVSWTKISGVNPIYDNTTSFKMNLISNPDKIVYIAAQDNNPKGELYIMNYDGSGKIILNSPLAGPRINMFAIANDKSKIFYIGEQDTNNVPEIYSINLDGTSRVKLNGALPPGAFVLPELILLSSVHSKTYFMADAPTAGTLNLFSNNWDGSNLEMINPIPTTGGSINFAEISPDENTLIYQGDVEQDNLYEIYAYNISSGGSSIKLSGSIVSGGNLTFSQSWDKKIQVNSTSSKIVYMGTKESSIKTDIFSVNLDGSNTKNLSVFVSNGFNVVDFQISDDGTKVIYKALSSITPLTSQLFVSDIVTGAKLTNSKTPLPGEKILSYKTKGEWIYYQLKSGYKVEMYRLKLDGSIHQKIHEDINDMISFGLGPGFGFSQDGSLTYYSKRSSNLVDWSIFMLSN